MTEMNSDPVETPLTETTVLILLSLAPGPRHGYAIMKDVQTLSQGRVSLSTGTLYGALKRLVDLAWIRRVDDPEDHGTARERKAYALAEAGRRALGAELARLRALMRTAQRRLSEAAE